MLSAVNEESAAYQSQLIIYSDQPLDLAAINEKAIYRSGPAPAIPERPGPVTDATDKVLADVRAKAVLPVVASLLTADELEHLHLAWGCATA